MTGVVDSDRQPPPWLRWLGNDAAKVLSGGREQTAPVGCHFFHDAVEHIWEITLFVMATEVVGGPADGSQLTSRFEVDVNALVSLFDSTPQLRWQSGACADDDQLGCHLSLEGLARGRDVWMRVLQLPPADFEPGRRYFSDDGRFENIA